MFTIKFYYVLNLITQIKFSVIVPVHAVLFFCFTNTRWHSHSILF